MKRRHSPTHEDDIFAPRADTPLDLIYEITAQSQETTAEERASAAVAAAPPNNVISMYLVVCTGNGNFSEFRELPIKFKGLSVFPFQHHPDAVVDSACDWLLGAPRLQEVPGKAVVPGKVHTTVYAPAVTFQLDNDDNEFFQMSAMYFLQMKRPRKGGSPCELLNNINIGKNRRVCDKTNLIFYNDFLSFIATDCQFRGIDPATVNVLFFVKEDGLPSTSHRIELPPPPNRVPNVPLARVHFDPAHRYVPLVLSMEHTFGRQEDLENAFDDHRRQRMGHLLLGCGLETLEFFGVIDNDEKHRQYCNLRVQGQSIFFTLALLHQHLWKQRRHPSFGRRTEYVVARYTLAEATEVLRETAKYMLATHPGKPYVVFVKEYEERNFESSFLHNFSHSGHMYGLFSLNEPTDDEDDDPIRQFQVVDPHTGRGEGLLEPLEFDDDGVMKAIQYEGFLDLMWVRREVDASTEGVGGRFPLQPYDEVVVPQNPHMYFGGTSSGRCRSHRRRRQHKQAKNQSVRRRKKQGSVVTNTQKITR
jgi:hypothetical protein